MATLLTATEAAAPLGVDQATFARLLESGAIHRRADDAPPFWPEEIALAAMRGQPEIAAVPSLGPLLVFARVAVATTDPAEITTAAARLAQLLKGRSDGMPVLGARPDSSGPLRGLNDLLALALARATGGEASLSDDLELLAAFPDSLGKTIGDGPQLLAVLA